MKKITFYTVLTTLLGWAGFVQAQTPIMPETSTSDAPKYYLIKSYRSNGYLTANPNGTATHEQLANITANSIWFFEGSISSVTAGSTTTDQFVGKIGNEGVEGKFLTSVGTNRMDETGTDWYVRAHKFPTNPSTNGLAISIDAGLSSNIDANNHNNGTGMYGGTETDFNGTTWNVIPLETALTEFAEQITDIESTLGQTLNEVKSLIDDAKATTSGTIGSYTAEAIATLEEIYNANTTAGSTDNAKLHQILVLRAAIANFKASPIIKPAEGYYQFKCMYDNNYLAANSFGMNPSKSKNILIVDVNKSNPSLESIWKLEYLDDSQSTFSLMNVATGEYIDNVYGASGVNTCSKPSAMSFTYNYKKGETVSYGGKDVPVPAGSIAIKGSNYTVFFGGSDISNYWDGVGSVWSIESVTEEKLNSYITDDAIAKLDQYFEAPSPKIYSVNDFKPASAANEKTALEANKTYANYAAYVEAVKATVSQIDENAYYYIISAYKTFDDNIDRYVYVDTDNSLKWTKSKSNEVSMLWKVTSYTDDYNAAGYNFTSVNYNKKLRTAGYDGTAGTTDENWSISIVPSPVANAKEGGVQLIHYVSGDRNTLALTGATLAQPTKEEDNKGLSGYNDNAANVATHFLLVRAESVNLNTTATSDGNWSTTYLPIAVQLPAEATAYYVSAAADGKAALKECAENKIAAEEGVVIKSDEAGTIAATILTEDVSKADNNLLKGSLTGTNVPEAGYILADKTRGVGFYKIDPTKAQIAGNKAYLEVSAASAAGIKAFTFDFGGTTGIENTEAVTEVEEYYDLQGRRVMNPTKGIYVTKSGKKVLFTK